MFIYFIKKNPVYHKSTNKQLTYFTFILGRCLQVDPSPHNFNSPPPPPTPPPIAKYNAFFDFIVKSNALKKTH